MQSLHLTLEYSPSDGSPDGPALATGTGFVVEHNADAYLITNRHNFTGRGVDGELRSTHGVAPDRVLIRHHKTRESVFGATDPRHEMLRSSTGKPLWFEHPTHKQNADVVALRLSEASDGVRILPYTVQQPVSPVQLVPSDGVSIIGFPFGRAAHDAMGIWVRGFVASEPRLDFEGMPRFLVDARTRPGQSGSPVIFYAEGGPVRLSDGSQNLIGKPYVELLGVYSGRIRADSDLGYVWKASLIYELLQAKWMPPSVPEEQ